jgi:uncharacterized membrane protein YdjX (TVP38/TMEM64 family)
VLFALEPQDLFTLEGLKAQRAALEQWHRQAEWPFIAGFFVLFVLMAALSLPGGALLPLAAGAVFGFAQGALIASFAAAIGATLAFLASRWLLRDWARARFGPWLERVNAGIERDGACYLFALRVVPGIPALVVNCASGLTRLRTATYYAVSQAGMLPPTLVYVYAGTRLASLQSPADILSPALLAALGALAVLPLLVRRSGRARLGSRDPAPGPARVAGAGLAPKP